MTDSRYETVSGSAAINGAEIHYDVTGEGQPLVLVHAGIADSRMWDAQIAPLSRHFRVVRHDLRGVGRSTMPPGLFSHHDDLKKLLLALDIERAHVLGLSMGGGIALDFTLSHPQMVNRLVLAAVLGPPPFSQSLRDGWTAAEEAFEREGLAGVNEVEMRMWVDGPGRNPDEVNQDVRDRVAAMNIDILRREEEGEGVSEKLDPPAATRLASVSAPTLVIAGDGDQPDVLSYCDKLAAEIPAARLERIPAVAHMINMEAPQQFNDLVVNFLIE